MKACLILRGGTPLAQNELLKMKAVCVGLLKSDQRACGQCGAKQRPVAMRWWVELGEGGVTEDLF